jgi:hypothetical protein
MALTGKTVAVSIVFGAMFGAGVLNGDGKTAHDPSATLFGDGPAVLWHDPVDIATRDLYYGSGGKAREPRGTLTFQKEIMNGSSPKFEAVDEDGIRWTVKLGDEARPETAASRFLWAAGYFATEDYFVPELQVQNLPRLHRGREFVSHGNTVRSARLKRHAPDQRKLGSWSWQNNPFAHTREWYALQVLMALMNNWDVKDSNNSIYQVGGRVPEQRYMVTDLGATFGGTRLNGITKSKGKLADYRHSNWIGRVSDKTVDFNVPSPPTAPVFFNLPEFSLRMSLLWIGRNVPIADARWMGHLLSRLSPVQIRDAFRGAGYSPSEVEAYSRIVEERIAQLQELQATSKRAEIIP